MIRPSLNGKLTPPSGASFAGAEVRGSTMDTSSRISSYYKTVAVWIERLLALVILGGVLVFGLYSVPTMAEMDWRLTETFYELIYRVLLLVIGVELVRTLVTHELRAI